MRSLKHRKYMWLAHNYIIVNKWEGYDFNPERLSAELVLLATYTFSWVGVLARQISVQPKDKLSQNCPELQPVVWRCRKPPNSGGIKAETEWPLGKQGYFRRIQTSARRLN